MRILGSLNLLFFFCKFCRKGSSKARTQMKFCKRYQEFIITQKPCLNGVSYLELKKFKKILKRCTLSCPQNLESTKDNAIESASDALDGGFSLETRSTACPVCDGMFFPSLLHEMASVVGCFNERAKHLVTLHIASGLRRFLMWVTRKKTSDRLAMVKEGENLVIYASINAVAIRKILKKYDKIHHSRQGQEFRTRVNVMQMQILQSPWLNELVAFCMNVMESNIGPEHLEDLRSLCSFTFNNEIQSISYSALDLVKMDIDLTCPICLETLFDPVSLKCGHIFCYYCACTVASVTTFVGLKTTMPHVKCPMCRQAGVFGDVVKLVELNILLSRSCQEYWRERLERERIDRLQQVKEHWKNQSRTILGI